MKINFSEKIIDWQKLDGRHDLPWQNCVDPYRIWVSEIMLQQTQVSSVIPYYNRFMAIFPDIATLASATQDAVLAQWSGLGYYSRARKLHSAAIEIMELYGGKFPATLELMVNLPGIGRTTAAAICVFAFGMREAILDGNVKRVLMRYFAIEGDVSYRVVEKKLWALAHSLLPENDIRTYTQGLMDLGATCCKPRGPQCTRCPLHKGCLAFDQGKTQEIPAIRPRKTIPEKQTVMLIVQWEGKLLFERQPEHGLWGGLYVFPQMETVAAAESFLCHTLGFERQEGEWLEPLKHTFSHFRLAIRPWLIHPDVRMDRSLKDRIWLTHKEALARGLPAPVRKLVRRIFPVRENL